MKIDAIEQMIRTEHFLPNTTPVTVALVGKDGAYAHYKITWQTDERTYTQRIELAQNTPSSKSKLPPRGTS